jgi:hypothetical protein
MRNTRFHWFAAPLLAIGLLIAGCSKVTDSNFDKIKADPTGSSGSTEQEVTDILGQPSPQSSTSVALPGLSAGAKTWTDGNKSITVTFLNGKATAKMKNGF